MGMDLKNKYTDLNTNKYYFKCKIQLQYETQLKVPPLFCIGSLISKFGVVLIEICNVLLLVLKNNGE